VAPACSLISLTFFCKGHLEQWSISTPDWALPQLGRAPLRLGRAQRMGVPTRKESARRAGTWTYAPVTQTSAFAGSAVTPCSGKGENGPARSHPLNRHANGRPEISGSLVLGRGARRSALSVHRKSRNACETGRCSRPYRGAFFDVPALLSAIEKRTPWRPEWPYAAARSRTASQAGFFILIQGGERPLRPGTADSKRPRGGLWATPGPGVPRPLSSGGGGTPPSVTSPGEDGQRKPRLEEILVRL
jgi:hypothetical protein